MKNWVTDGIPITAGMSDNMAASEAARDIHRRAIQHPAGEPPLREIPVVINGQPFVFGIRTSGYSVVLYGYNVESGERSMRNIVSVSPSGISFYANNGIPGIEKDESGNMEVL